MRQSSSRRSLAVMMAAAALVAGAVTSVAVPVALNAVPTSAVIATVDLESLISQLDEKNVAEASLKAYSESLRGELETLNKGLKDQENKVQVLDGAAKKEAFVKLIEMRANLKVKGEVFDAFIDQRRGEAFKGLYEKITAAVQALAKQSGYTMVIVSDEKVRIPVGPSADIERTISLKRFLFVEKSHDITADVAKLMNNEFKAGTPAAGASK